jgi:hypothetical protein
MVECCQHFRFALEPRQSLAIGCDTFGKDFEGNVAAERGVACAVHLAHAAGGKERKDLVRADTLAGLERGGFGDQANGRRGGPLARWLVGGRVG